MDSFVSRRRRRVHRSAILALMFSLGTAALPAAAEDPQVSQLRQEVEQLRRRDEENRARMAEMERMLRELLAAQKATAATAAAKADSAVAKAGPPSSATVSAKAPAAASPQDALDRALAAGSTVAPAPAAPAPASTPAAALDKALQGTATASAAPPPGVVPGGSTSGSIWSRTLGSGAGAPVARLMDISMVTLVAGGGSTANNQQLGELEAGGHDPNRNGFTLQQAELSLSGAVDPYFTGETHIVATAGGIELEEAFLTTTSLPWGLQVEAGYSLTEFGLLNPLHAHAWDWMDQPVVLSRMFGPDGLRSPGMRVGWLLPLPFFSELHVGVQNADEGDLTASFMGGEGIGGRPNVDRQVDSADDLLWLGRWNASWDLSRTSALLLGTSFLYGPNSTGNDGKTLIYGADFKYRWRRPGNFRGWPFFLVQGEFIHRDYTADWFIAGTESGGGGDDGHDHGHDHGGDTEEEEPSFPNDLAANTLRDNGFYVQALHGFRWGWAAGFRTEYDWGSGASIIDGAPGSRGQDPYRDDRLRLSPLLIWQPTEFSRLRLQYNYDKADFLTGGDAHTVWVGAEITYGEHGAHKY